MKQYFRLLWLFLSFRRQVPCSLLGPCSTRLRVWPNDLDIFLHMNNGVYLTLMDLGRTDMMLRAGVFRKIWNNGWYPVAAAETIRFRRSLTLFQRFTIHTRVMGWDETSIFILQTFERAGETVAEAVVDARFLNRVGGKVTPQELLDFIGETRHSQPLPAWLLDWRALHAKPLEA